jgi:ParB family chromosome partitioning protein
MENKRRALGKGLEQLFNAENLDFNQIETSIVEGASKDEIIQVKLLELRSNPYQPRKVFDEAALKELSDSIKAIVVERDVVIAIAGQAAEACVGIERITAGGVGNQRKELCVSKIVDPGIRGPWSLDDVFTIHVVKMAEFHIISSR